VQKWWYTSVVAHFMKMVIMDIYKSQAPELQPWFRETREAKFGTTLEKVSIEVQGLGSIASPKQDRAQVDKVHHGGCLQRNRNSRDIFHRLV
jgi:hypothetical protein